jgi:hypothetical protein
VLVIYLARSLADFEFHGVYRYMSMNSKLLTCFLASLLISACGEKRPVSGVPTTVGPGGPATSKTSPVPVVPEIDGDLSSVEEPEDFP